MDLLKEGAQHTHTVNSMSLSRMPLRSEHETAVVAVVDHARNHMLSHKSEPCGSRSLKHRGANDYGKAPASSQTAGKGSRLSPNSSQPYFGKKKAVVDHARNHMLSQKIEPCAKVS